MLPDTATRVEQNTADRFNARIRRETEHRVQHFASHPERIDRRLDELDREWDIERVLEANAATISLLGIVLAARVDKRFLLLPGVVAGFLLEHAVQGWCPPVPFFRRRGVRTAAEIDRERYALKALRGDFRDAAAGPPRERAHAALAAAN
jgi:hypothetical protein